jgi:hypothetical protein
MSDNSNSSQSSGEQETKPSNPSINKLRPSPGDKKRHRRGDSADVGQNENDFQKSNQDG